MPFSSGKLYVNERHHLLVSPEFDGVTAGWFEPSSWGENAVSVAAGGRGGAWFIRSGEDEFVLRQYRRGGLVGKWIERTYLYLGLKRTRSFSEYQLTRQLSSAGLPVPRAVAAMVRRVTCCFYRASIVVERIPGAVNWPDSPEVSKDYLWIQIGRMIRNFHNWGLDHVDLNCDNILIADGKAYLIDFDRCRRRKYSRSRRWQTANLQRLKRSVDKRLGDSVGLDVEHLWQQLLSGYHNGTS
ncbi:3-deoxy-D-manno-octulosonic acid kinase [Marinobacter sp. VGCF2001]|uniref:3-deoxy-D-manno-octulosonic acid kinase n=1 Tax=Marinobacter sp. VGCF2001 TaxID=3417189 RepID=UPI003CF5C345